MKYALRVKLDTDAPQVALLPPPGVRRIEFTILMNWSTARTRSWGTLCACAPGCRMPNRCRPGSPGWVPMTPRWCRWGRSIGLRGDAWIGENPAPGGARVTRGAGTVSGAGGGDRVGDPVDVW
jgi:hypothetical protein